jgi:hypothetical protein
MGSGQLPSSPEIFGARGHHTHLLAARATVVVGKVTLSMHTFGLGYNFAPFFVGRPHCS